VSPVLRPTCGKEKLSLTTTIVYEKCMPLIVLQSSLIAVESGLLCTVCAMARYVNLSLLMIYFSCSTRTFFPVVLSQSCYNPDGSLESGNRPCNPGVHSPCCGTGWGCRADKVCECESGNGCARGSLARGSCSDSTWKSPDCPSVCINGDVSKCVSAMSRLH